MSSVSFDFLSMARATDNGDTPRNIQLSNPCFQTLSLKKKVKVGTLNICLSFLLRSSYLSVVFHIFSNFFMQEREQEMIARMQEADANVKQLVQDFDLLLQQDARKNGVETAQNVEPMSPQELRQTYNNVNKNYRKLVNSFNKSFPKT